MHGERLGTERPARRQSVKSLTDDPTEIRYVSAQLDPWTELGGIQGHTKHDFSTSFCVFFKALQPEVT